MCVCPILHSNGQVGVSIESPICLYKKRKKKKKHTEREKILTPHPSYKRTTTIETDSCLMHLHVPVVTPSPTTPLLHSLHN